MFNTSNIDEFTASLDEQLPRTPHQNRGYSKRTFFSQRELNGDFRFSPSAWNTPERPHTGGTPIKSGTPQASPSGPFGTPGAYSAVVSPSRIPHGMPSLYQSPMGITGVTPARVMGPFPRRDLFFETTPTSSPISMLAHRKIYTPKSLRDRQAKSSLEERGGPSLLDTSLFGMAGPPSRLPATPISRISTPYTGTGTLDPSPTSFALPILPPCTASPPLEAASIQSNVGVVEGMDSDGEDETNTEEDGEDERDTEENSEDEDEGVNYHTQSLTEYIHSQHGAQNGSTDDDGNVWLPFPYDRDNLTAYLEQGLSLRYLFPSSIQGDRIRCEAELGLTGRLWKRTGTCNESKGSAESYQRHVKSKHLGVKRGKEVGLGHIVNTVWGCNKTMPKQPKTWLRVHRFDPHMQDFPFAA